jgi:hypothetical protein
MSEWGHLPIANPCMRNLIPRLRLRRPEIKQQLAIRHVTHVVIWQRVARGGTCGARGDGVGDVEGRGKGGLEGEGDGGGGG